MVQSKSPGAVESGLLRHKCASVSDSLRLADLVQLVSSVPTLHPHSRDHVPVVVIGIVFPRNGGHGGGMHRIAVGKGDAALTDEIADGIVGVAVGAGRVFDSLALAECSVAGAEPIQIVVRECPAGGE